VAESYISYSIVASIPACRAGDPSSIYFLRELLDLLLLAHDDENDECDNDHA